MPTIETSSDSQVQLEALAWEVGPSDNAAETPAVFVPATVPGAVQLDWARAQNWPQDWHYGDRFRQFDCLEDKWWTYRTTLPKRKLGAAEIAHLMIGGVDYACTVHIAGEFVYAHEGMFTPFSLDVSRYLDGRSEVHIVVQPAPKARPEPGREQAASCVKPAVSYGWDWHPRVIPLGLWENAGLVVRPRVHLQDCELRYRLSEDMRTADLEIWVEASDATCGSLVRWRLTDDSGREAWVGEACLGIAGPLSRCALSQPRLWWPHDQGEPHCYTLQIELVNTSGPGTRLVRRVGIRRIRLVMHPEAWREPKQFPKSRSAPPITIEVNGRRIFAKGSNLVSTDVFPGTTRTETYRCLVDLARAAHFNLLRVWGGSVVPKSPFWDACDELGIMVWQEFPLSCNLYPDTEDYLSVLNRESRSIIRRLRKHPCLALWCGGNELFNSWSGMTDQSLPIRLLNRNAFDLDQNTPFIPTAPIDSMGHGDYRFLDSEGNDVFRIFTRAKNTAYSEFGCPGPSPTEVLKRIIPTDELFPPRPGTSWSVHHGLGAWDVAPTTWLCTDVLQHYFGSTPDLESLVARGTWLQCTGYQFVFEEARRQAPRCAMALNWCFNEPWPSAANNNIVTWPATPKPAYHSVAAACRPTLASARPERFCWYGGDIFHAELWLLHDAPQERPAARMDARIILNEVEIFHLTWDLPSGQPQTNLIGPELRVALPINAPEGELRLELTVAEQPAWNSIQRLLYKRAIARENQTSTKRSHSTTLNA